MAAYEVLLLNTAIPQIQAAQSGDTYLVPRDIAFSAALTLSAGTANGVPYLSSPGKVLTTGSALTFDGTTLGVANGVAGGTSLSLTGSYTGSGNVNLISFQRVGGAVAGALRYSDDNPFGMMFGTTTSHAQIFMTANTERMRISSAGDVGIGATSPEAKLDVLRQGNTSGGTIMMSGSKTNNSIKYGNLTGAHYNNSTYPQGICVVGILSTSDDNFVDIGGNVGEQIAANTIRFWTAANTTTAGGTERARITSGGEFQIGPSGGNGTGTISASPAGTGFTNQPGSDLVLQSGNSTGTGASIIKFLTPSAGSSGTSTNTATERARISSDGTFRVKGAGTAGTTDAVQFSGSAPASAMTLDASGNLLVGKTTTGTANQGAVINANGNCLFTVTDTGANDTLNVWNDTASAYRFYVTRGGVINATSTTISAISDQRLKENIRDLDVGLNAVLALKPRKFDWKAGKGKDIKGDRGWIAQEFEQVFPDMIDTWKDEAPKGEEPYKSVRADLIPVLVKAIQEQQAMINELKAEVAALKGA